ncbi:MAG: PQQ-dependent sugar dehydrogenase [Chloroflexaceae bacterium]|jgi:glucose/arabinose dehydrogenase|nr:PQQ-dependent sugar dehydrogenase [Chloroflexaceae bacterium]
MRRGILLLICTSLLLAGCGVAGTAQQPTAAPAPTAAAATAAPAPTSAAAPGAPTATAATAAPAAATAAPAVPATAPNLTLQEVASGFTRPIHVTSAGDGSGRLFVIEQRGIVNIVREGQRLEQPFLDIEPLVGSSGNEQGLLSIAFHPEYASNGQFFVNYTNREGDTVVARYRVSADPNVADPGSATVLLTIDQPAANHNGGMMAFGPDGYLYIGMGDGGRAGDPWNNAQNLDALLGKMLRIDVNSENGEPYAIPSDNPFVGQNGARPEIWAYGLRNPWRFSFDRQTGDMYIADVGQNAQEEVHFQPAASQGGENYGWRMMEGDLCFPAGENCDRQGLELPFVTYGRGEGCSITGGYVYRGSAYPQMAGFYIYADYCSGNMWAIHQVNGTWQNRLVAETDSNISSFGQDEGGELYLTDREGGTLYRVVVAG